MKKRLVFPVGMIAIALATIALAGCAPTVSASPVGAATISSTPAQAASATPTATPSPTPTVTAVDPAAYNLPWLGATEGVAFNSPDNNIACGIDINPETFDSYGCAIVKRTYTEPPRPADAVDPCGHGFWVAKNGPATILCSGEPASFAGQPGGAQHVKILAIGTSITFNRVTCTSAENGITCLSSDGHGFRISAASYNLYK